MKKYSSLLKEVREMDISDAAKAIVFSRKVEQQERVRKRFLKRRLVEWDGNPFFSKALDDYFDDTCIFRHRVIESFPDFLENPFDLECIPCAEMKVPQLEVEHLINIHEVYDEWEPPKFLIDAIDEFNDAALGKGYNCWDYVSHERLDFTQQLITELE